jgi:ankyrin repeat protein
MLQRQRVQRFKAGRTDMAKAENLFALLEDGEFNYFKVAADRCPRVRVICDKNGNFLLHRAAEVGSPDFCKYLLKKGILATCPGPSGVTPIHIAAERGYLDIMKVLLRAAGANHSPINRVGITPLHVAAGEGYLAIVKLLVAKGAGNLAGDKYGRLPIHFAVGADQLDVVKWLVTHNPALIELPDAFGQRPIHWALRFESYRTVKWLTKYGVDMSSSDIYGRTPESFKGLKLTPLQLAIMRNDVKEIKNRLRTRWMLNRPADLGRTPLHTAAFFRNRDLYQWLVKEGADDTVLDDYGCTPGKLLSYRLTKSLRGGVFGEKLRL